MKYYEAFAKANNSKIQPISMSLQKMKIVAPELKPAKRLVTGKTFRLELAVFALHKRFPHYLLKLERR
jgi:hypothetical protein